MRKLLLLSFFVIPTLLVAQDNQETSDYKAAAGERTLELRLAPFGSSPISISGLRYRSFTMSQQAFRLNVNVGINSNTAITQQEDPENNEMQLKSSSSSVFVSVAPGIEYHLKGTERLSPYYGWQGSIGYRNSTAKNEFQSGDEIYYQKTVNAANDPGFFRLGASVLAGLDFYVTKKLYLGTEISFGASYTNNLSTKSSSDAPNFTQQEPVKRGSTVNLGINANSQIRLGLAF